MTSKRASRRTVCIIRGVKELHQIKETNVVMWRDVLLQWRHKHTGPEKNKINEVTNSRLLCLNGKQCYEYCSCVYVYGYKYDINPVLLLGCVIQRNEYFLRKKKSQCQKRLPCNLTKPRLIKESSMECKLFAFYWRNSLLVSFAIYLAFSPTKNTLEKHQHECKAPLSIILTHHFQFRDFVVLPFSFPQETLLTQSVKIGRHNWA